jgi:hypothetical protein
MSHEITFFLPLGWGASDFDVLEWYSSEFEASYTNPLDKQLRQAASDEQEFADDLRLALFPGSFLISGGWGLPLLGIFALAGCGTGAPPPVEVFHTDSSRVSIYGIDENTDLAALVAATGLDPSVQETLRAFEGQQIAVVSMRTQPPPGGDTSGYGRRQTESQLGLRLQWASRAVERAGGGWEHRYPLGTGRAWARPIPLTRVYVTAPEDVDFRVDYPIYGTDRSGYDRGEPNIYHHLDETSYAVNDAITSQGHIWRAIYTQANPTVDLHIIHDGEATDLARAQMTRDRLRGLAQRWSWLVDPVLAVIMWVACWRFVMPRHLGRTYGWLDPALWRDALVWPLLNGLVLGVVTFLFIYFDLDIFFIFLLSLIYFFLALPVFVIRFSRRYGDRQSDAQRGCWKVVTLANIGYLFVGAVYTILIEGLLT